MDRRIATFLMVSAGLIALVSAIRPLPRTSAAIERWFWVNKVYDESKYEVVAFGDSRIYRGFATPVADSITGVPTLNYGFSAACATPEMLDAVDARLIDGGTLIIGITPFFIYEREKTSNRLFNMISHLESHAVFRRKYIDRHIWRLIDPIIAVDLIHSVGGIRTGLFERMYPSGYCATKAFPPDSSRANASFIKRFREQLDAVDNLPYLIGHVAIWHKRGITVFAVQPPISSGLASIEDTLGRYDVHLVRKRLEDAGVIWINLPRTGYITYDGSHLDERSAIVWTQQVTDSVISLHPHRRFR